MADCDKIQLRQAGYRLIDRVDDDVVFVTVTTVGRRDRDQAYDKASRRLT